MRIFEISLAFALEGVILTQAHAQGPENHAGTVQGYYELCTSKEWTLKETCEFFIIGAGDVMGVQGQSYQEAPSEVRAYLQKTSLCTGTRNYVPPADAMVQAFINWAKKHPEKWDNAGVVGVALALSETWPCQK